MIRFFNKKVGSDRVLQGLMAEIDHIYLVLWTFVN